MNESLISMWVEVVVGTLLVISGVFAFVGALGLLRLKDFMLRMHAPALGYTLGSWCVALALTVYFSALESSFSPRGLLIVIFLALTVPVTALILARAALFRNRQAGRDVPRSLADK